MDFNKLPPEPAALAGTILRALRASAGMSQRELAAAARLSTSTIARAEAGSKSPSWGSMVRAAAAADCSVWIINRAGDVIEPWEFDTAGDRADRHLPAHLKTWRVERPTQWSGWLRYSTWADPPTPEVTFRMRDPYDVAAVGDDTRVGDDSWLGDDGGSEGADWFGDSELEEDDW